MLVLDWWLNKELVGIVSLPYKIAVVIGRKWGLKFFFISFHLSLSCDLFLLQSVCWYFLDLFYLIFWKVTKSMKGLLGQRFTHSPARELSFIRRVISWFHCFYDQWSLWILLLWTLFTLICLLNDDHIFLKILIFGFFTLEITPYLFTWKIIFLLIFLLNRLDC